MLELGKDILVLYNVNKFDTLLIKINVLQQTACLVVSPISADNFVFLFDCMPVGRTSDSMAIPTIDDMVGA